MIELFQLIRNVGQFDSVAAAQLPLTKLSLIYAENGRGKTTLASIFRSLSTGDAVAINERKRLGSTNLPHIVLKEGGAPIQFQAGSWSRTLPAIAVFDDTFVSENVCSGLEVATGHRQNLHELILGAQGVSLNRTLQIHIDAIEEHNRKQRTNSDAIPATIRGALTVDAFCALKQKADIDTSIQAAERSLAAAQSTDAIKTRKPFAPIALPEFDVPAIEQLLGRSLPELEADAAARIQAHLTQIGAGGEGWVADGMSRTANTAGTCPFCEQNLSTSPLIDHYRAYFSAAYADLKKAIVDQISTVKSTHDGEIPAAFERAVLAAVTDREFWSAFIDAPEISIDTAEFARTWKAAREKIMAALRAKQAAPLEKATLPADALMAAEAFHQARSAILAVSDAMQEANAKIVIVKEQAASANVATLTADLAKLVAIKTRHTPEVVALCQTYLTEKAAKAATETLRDQARAALDQYRTVIFPTYETAINTYLQRFNAGFRLGSVNSVNSRTGSSCSYNVLINSVPVSITANNAGEPSFRTTLSAGDRNTLALAFFFASLDQDPNLAQKIVVIDDPMTSLDEHRSLTTVQQMRRLLDRVEQVIVLSHSKPFLCDLWLGADTATRTAIKIERDQTGSTLAAWDVNQDCITEHDRRHAAVSAYISTPATADERAVAAALRPILEAFARVAYPAAFPPGMLLGLFIGVCRQRVGTAAEILTNADITELRDLLDYANTFHHDTNAAWQTVLINDQELLHFCERTLAFARRA
jgi:wobble nucleotide-excising tRNase